LISFSPDGTRIVTGSWDSAIWLWDAATRQASQQCAVSDLLAFSDEYPTIEATTTTKSNTWNNYFISFSSDFIHALCNTSDLTEGAFHEDHSLISILTVDGWYDPNIGCYSGYHLLLDAHFVALELY
jgi:hypothetical protein